MNAAEILVIILSIFLSIFLLIGIVLGILLVKVTMQIKKVTTSAERAAFNMEQMTAGIGKASSKLLIGKIFMKAAKTIINRKKG